jgi:hypothetical protein
MLVYPAYSCACLVVTLPVQGLVANLEKRAQKQTKWPRLWSLYKTFEELPLVNTGCDSYASWHPDFKHLSPTYTVEELVDKMTALLPRGNWLQPNGNPVHLVITGGEPLLGWQRAYPELLDVLHERGLRHITFETNGTQDLTREFKDYLRNWFGEITFSVSPKLSVSGESWEDAIKPDVVWDYETYGVTYLKFVVEKIAGL